MKGPRGNRWLAATSLLVGATIIALGTSTLLQQRIEASVRLCEEQAAKSSPVVAGGAALPDGSEGQQDGRLPTTASINAEPVPKSSGCAQPDWWAKFAASLPGVKGEGSPVAGLAEGCESAWRAEAVRRAMQHAWRGYERFAMGSAELHPMSKKAKEDIKGGAGISGLGVTVVDAMTTLHIMGLKDDFDRARDFVWGSLSFDRDVRVSFFETVIRLLGGLVSCYDLSGDSMFLERAQDLADRLMHAFHPTSGLPAGTIHLSGSEPDESKHNWLAAVGSFMLEFSSLAQRTGEAKYLAAAERGIRRLHRCYPKKALLNRDLDPLTGKLSGSVYTVGAGADSYFEYLLKYWILTGKQDEHWRRRWEAAADEALEQLVPGSTPNGSITFASLRNSGYTLSVVEHLACFWPGNMALGVMHGAVQGAKAQKYLRFAEGMTKACYQLYHATPTGLGAEEAHLNLQSGKMKVTNAQYFQRPEVIESIFHLYRATRNPMYREWGWRMFQAFHRHCRQAAGYSGVKNVMKVPPIPDDTQQSWLLAETLKYWYLLFAPDSALSLEDWVLNTEAHPLRAWRPSSNDSAGNATFIAGLFRLQQQGGGQGQAAEQRGAGAKEDEGTGFLEELARCPTDESDDEVDEEDGSDAGGDEAVEPNAGGDAEATPGAAGSGTAEGGAGGDRGAAAGGVEGSGSQQQEGRQQEGRQKEGQQQQQQLQQAASAGAGALGGAQPGSQQQAQQQAQQQGEGHRVEAQGGQTTSNKRPGQLSQAAKQAATIAAVAAGDSVQVVQ